MSVGVSLVPESWSAAALVAARVGGLLLVAPVYATRPVPVGLRAALLVLFTVLVTPLAVSGGGPPRVTAAALATETVVGFALGLGAAVFVGAAEVAGDLLAIQTGLSGAHVFDPSLAQAVPVLSDFARLFAVTLVLATDGHVVMLEALVESARRVPVGVGLAVSAGLWELVSLGAALFGLGLRFAAPVTAAVLVANVALGVLARAVPQLQVLMVAFPVQVAVGLATLAAAVPLAATLFVDWPAAYGSVVSALLAALAER